MVKTLCKKPCGKKGEHQGSSLKPRYRLYTVQSLGEKLDVNNYNRNNNWEV